MRLHHGLAVTNDDLRYLREKDHGGDLPMKVLEHTHQLISVVTWPNQQEVFRNYG